MRAVVVVVVVVVRAAGAAFFGLALETATLAGFATFVIVGFFGAAACFFFVAAFLATGLPTRGVEDRGAAAAS